MSKIFEALEHSRRSKADGESKKAPISKASVPPPVVEAFALGLQSEMVTLYQAVDSLLPNVQKKIIQFIGAREGEGVSTIAREFALIAATKL
ncbi:MAG: hypothetical protein ACLPN1_07300, partial [Dissulfurispiraceae bacterium]